MPTAIPFHAPVPAVTPTPDGSGQAMHPDVIDFGTEGWRGWRFWMAMTPLPNGDEAQENPCILVSNDAFNWAVPHGLTNPVFPWPGYSFNSDTALRYDTAGDRLVMIWKGPKNAEDNWFPFLYSVSTDGIVWSAQAVLTVTPTPTWEHVSPALEQAPDGSWYMWTQETTGAPVRRFIRWEASDLTGPWVNPTACSVGAVLHHNITRNLDTGVYHMAYAPDRSRFALASSIDGLAWSAGTTVMQRGVGTWDSYVFYRPAITPHENGTHNRVWYSAATESAVWHTGYVTIPISAWPAPPVP